MSFSSTRRAGAGAKNHSEYKRTLADSCWQQRVRNAGVFARGTVRHRDHATITLHEWHQVWMNMEDTTRQMANVAFLD
jgi:hypothetical protein